MLPIGSSSRRWLRVIDSSTAAQITASTRGGGAAIFEPWSELDRGADLKRVYQHNGLYFGILVCSELQNMGYRADFQSRVDCLITLSWNKDLESFSALVDAAALDVHAYMALVNNRRYGDSRLRRPAKRSFDRDVCRVRGGLNDQLVVVEIEPTRLRRQQSREKRWSRPTDA